MNKVRNNQIIIKNLVCFMLMTLLVCQIGGSAIFAQTTREIVREPANINRIEKRIALVIGNGSYRYASKLDNPTNDATDMAKALRDLGFEVIGGDKEGLNVSQSQMEKLINEFGSRLAETKGVGLFYYAGHGITSNGQNYLIPADANIPDEESVKYKAVSIDYVLDTMASARNTFNLVILDACRNNPFARSWRSFRDIGNSKGLVNSNPPRGTLVLYAAQPGGVSIDGVGSSKNGLFTQALLKQIKKPNLELDPLIKALARDIEATSNQEQSPWKEGLYSGDFYFAGLSNEVNKESDTQKDVTLIERDKASVEQEAWINIKNSLNPQDFRNYLKDFPFGINKNNAKVKLEQAVWDSVKDSKDKAKFQSYLNEFQTGVNAPLARIKLKQLESSTLPTINTTIASKSTGVISKTLLTGGVGISFVYISPGEFEMGGVQLESERPVHKAKISQGFWLQTTEVTQAQWHAVIGNNPSYYKDCSDCPVEQVSWNDVQSFIEKLNAQNSDYKYRLPTEAEWEYSARAGTTDDNSRDIDLIAWYTANSDNKTHPVGQKLPNAWGLYDMYGNVWEWVQDYYEKYPSGIVVSPIGPLTGKYRVYRGGSWDVAEGYLRSAARLSNQPSKSNSGLGFRLVRQ